MDLSGLCRALFVVVDETTQVDKQLAGRKGIDDAEQNRLHHELYIAVQVFLAVVHDHIRDAQREENEIREVGVLDPRLADVQHYDIRHRRGDYKQDVRPF